MSQPARILPPGEHLREEIEAREWSQTDFGRILGRPVKVVNEILNGKRAITPETAQEISRALGTSAQVWLNLESAYRLSLLPSNPGDRADDVERRARLFAKAPIAEMIRRGWIDNSNDVGRLERSVLKFFDIPSLDSEIREPAAAARAGLGVPSEFTAAQLAWMYRVRQLADAIQATVFDLERFKQDLSSIKAFMRSPEQVRHVPRFLAELGIRFMIVKQLRGTRIDGACLWARPNVPVVAMTMRFDRIDWFWHTLIHECAHVYHQDALSLDEDIEGQDSDRAQCERRADEFAANFMIPRAEIEDFMVRAGPMARKDRVLGFAARLKIHPGIVVGQLQFRNKNYSIHRAMLDRVRDSTIGSALTDGWGSSVRIK
jgi:HTH-type transcriptional regulator/antitoxin HigA